MKGSVGSMGGKGRDRLWVGDIFDLTSYSVTLRILSIQCFADGIMVLGR